MSSFFFSEYNTEKNLSLILCPALFSTKEHTHNKQRQNRADKCKMKEEKKNRQEITLIKNRRGFQLLTVGTSIKKISEI